LLESLGFFTPENSVKGLTLTTERMCTGQLPSSLLGNACIPVLDDRPKRNSNAGIHRGLVLMGKSPTRLKRREQILDGMFEAMTQRRADAVSISDIAASANIARGALHYYFESKDEIRSCLMEKLGQSYISNLERHLARQDTHCPAQLVRELVRFHFGESSSPQIAQLMGVWIEFWGQASRDPSLNHIVMEIQENARSICARIIETALPDLGDLPSGRLREASATILALIEGGLLQWRVALETKSPLRLDKLQNHIAQAVHGFLASLEAELDSPILHQQNLAGSAL
jgi:AcrR family transcriptional regulator